MKTKFLLKILAITLFFNLVYQGKSEAQIRRLPPISVFRARKETIERIARACSFLLPVGCASSDPTAPPNPPGLPPVDRGPDVPDITIDWHIAEGEEGTADIWEFMPPELWNSPPDDLHLLTASDLGIPIVTDGDIRNTGIGEVQRIEDTFDRITLYPGILGSRPGSDKYADITAFGQDVEMGLIFTYASRTDTLKTALTPEEWENLSLQKKYYYAIHYMIEVAGNKLLSDLFQPDFHQRIEDDPTLERWQKEKIRAYTTNPITGLEQEFFMLALKALVFQENEWQNYLCCKNEEGEYYHLAILSGEESPYNILDDWCCTGVARSYHEDPGNVRFFAEKGHVSLYSALSYGFLEYFVKYQHARLQGCNTTGNDKLTFLRRTIGAYNRYFSGYSSCYNKITDDPDHPLHLDYFYRRMKNKPWLRFLPTT